MFPESLTLVHVWGMLRKGERSLGQFGMRGRRGGWDFMQVMGATEGLRADQGPVHIQNLAKKGDDHHGQGADRHQTRALTAVLGEVRRQRGCENPNQECPSLARIPGRCGQQHHKLENKSNYKQGAGFGTHLAIQKLM